MFEELPPGFQVEPDSPKPTPKRRKASAPQPATQHLPEGFTVQSGPDLSPTGQVHDGDTYRTRGGANARMQGYDAFELDQTGRTIDGAPVLLGHQARDVFAPLAQPGATPHAEGSQTYGRPVVTLNNGGDVGRAVVASGLGIPEPQYLRDRPDLLSEYVQAQRGAIAAGRGAYAGQYQLPSDYRHQGQDAPWTGKELIAEQDRPAWEAMLRNPATTEAQVADWLAARHHSAANVTNILNLFRLNHQAQPRPDYQQTDVTGAPVAPAKSFLTRQGAAVTEGVVDLAGIPGEGAKVGAFGIPGMAVSSLLNNVQTGYGKDAQGRDSIIFSWKPKPAAEPLPELTVKSRPAVGKMRPDEVGAFADDPNRPKVGVRATAETTAAVERALRNLDVDGALAAAARDGIHLDRGSAELAVSVLRRHPGAPFGGQGPISYASTDRAAEVAHDAAGRANEAPGGAEALREFAHRGLKVGQLDESYAPQSTGERYLQAVERAAPSALVPIAGEGMMAGKLTRAMIASNAAGVAGMGVGGQAAADVAPGNPVVALAGQLLGGGLAGIGARRLGAGSHPAEAPRAGEPSAPDVGSEASVARSINIDGDSLRGLSHQEGGIDVAAAGEVLRHTANEALANGGTVTLHVEGKPVRIVGPDLTDEHGQRWGAMPILADATGGNRLEITEGTQRIEPMRAEIETPTLEGPRVDPEPRARDVIDVNDGPVRLLDPATERQRLEAAQRVSPDDILPRPASAPESLEEVAAIDKGRFAKVPRGDENAVLSSRGLPDPRDATQTVRTRGPVDLVQWLRSQGGLKPEGGELAHYGIDNAPRKGMPFTGNEDRVGPLVDPERGMTYDDAAMRAHEAGYFPDHVEPPTIPEFLDTLQATHTGRNRAFLPEDYPEIDAYDSALAQRHAVEAAKQEGAPLHEDRSQPVTMGDLDANAAPVEAYHEWGSSAPDYAGNIKLANLDSPQNIKTALSQVERVNGGFDAATRGRITHAETEALAADLNMTPRQLLARRKGQAFNAEEALAARQILAKSGNELVNAARRLKSKTEAGEASDADLAAFRKALVLHAAIQEQASGAAAEAGRALSQFRMIANSRAVRGDVLKSLIEAGGGKRTLNNAADIIVGHAADPKRISQDAKALVKPSIWDKLLEYRYNAMLSGPRTHAVNITSNLMTAMLQIPEHGAAAVIGTPRRLWAGKTADRVLFSETGARAVGMMQGAKEGLGAFVRTLRTGRGSDFGSSKVEVQKEAIGGRLGKFVRVPTRLLEAEDEFFKAAARRSDIVGLAVRNAAKEGLTGQAARARAAQLAASPTPEMVAHALDYGRYVTFQSKLGKLGNGVMALSNAHPVMKLFIPFVRTPMNLLKFAVERSPAAPVLSEWRADIKAGGARRDLALARTTLGSGAMMLAVKAAQQGLITGGGPSDESAKRLMQANGWQPYSVKIGGKYVSYNRLDPLSTTFGIAADYSDLQAHMTEKERTQVAALLVASTLKNLGNKTWLTGMSDLANAVSDPMRYGMREVSSQANSMVPAAVSQSAQAVDPYQRDAQSIIDRVKARIPFVSTTLPARRDVMGNPVANPSGGGLAAFSPVFVGVSGNDPTLAALTDAGVQIGKPSKTYSDPNNPRTKLEMSPAQFSAYQAAIGAAAKPALDDLVRGADWPDMTEEERQSEVEAIMREARETARDSVLEQGPQSPTPGNQLVAQMIAARKKTPEWQRLSRDDQKSDLARIASSARQAARDAVAAPAGGLPPGFVIQSAPPPGYVVQPNR